VSWQNWSGSTTLPAAEVQHPYDAAAVAELVARVRAERGTLRVIGAGHSFVPFWQPGDTLASLAHCAGLLALDGSHARIAAGTGLAAVGPLLARHGRALANMGDIDRQSLAGAISTGTHGTGRSLGSLASQVTAMELIGADSETTAIVDGDELAAARVSLGAFGIVTALTMETVPLYGLHERNQVEDVAQCFETLDRRADEHRHIEFWWLPNTDRCIVKTLDEIAVPDTEKLDDIPFGAPGERWGPSYRVFPSVRELKFNEMEYALPADAAPACFNELRTRLRAAFPKLPWPLEYRFVAGDDGWLSPTQGRATVTISVHQGAERPWQPLFEAVEPVLLAFGGRPHWGKIHTLDAAALAPLYPKLDAFATLVRARDPDGTFRNAYLERLLLR
jgi:FAD/FMN-containing dehydrogenase